MRPQNTLRKCRAQAVKALLGILLISATSGCSLYKYAYQHADWYLMYKMDQWFDLNEQQEEVIEPRLETALALANNTLLPGLSRTLKTFSAMSADGLDETEMIWLSNEYKELRINIIDLATPFFSYLLGSLTPEQKIHFKNKLALTNEDFQEKLALDDEDFTEHAAEEFLELCQTWYGDLTDTQQGDIKKIRGFTRPKTAAHLARRKIGQQRLLQAFTETTSEAEAKKLLTRWKQSTVYIRGFNSAKEKSDASKNNRLLFFKVKELLGQTQFLFMAAKLNEMAEVVDSLYK